jgi:4-amino-4-deoxy-L-arabinose transferase-like glycosyltransferase
VRAVDPFDHQEPWSFYLWNQFELLAPWSLLLPAALWHAVRRAKAAAAPGERWWRPASEGARRALFPLVAYGAILLMFSLSRSRRTYYLLPIAPFAALLVAGLVRDGALAVRDAPGRLGRLGLGAVGAAVLVVGLLLSALGVLRLATDRSPDMLAGRVTGLAASWPAIPPWLALLGLGLVLAGWLAFCLALTAPRAPGHPVAVLVAVGALLTFTEVGVIEPLRQAADPLPAFCAAAREIVPPGTPVEVGDLSGSRLKWYLDRPQPRDGEPASFRLVHADDLARTLHDAPGWTPVLGGTETEAVPAEASAGAAAQEGLVLLRRGPPAVLARQETARR